MPTRLLVIAALCAAAAEHLYDLSLREFCNNMQLERTRQDLQWGGAEHDRRHSAWDWVLIIVKHVGKLAGEVI